MIKLLFVGICCVASEAFAYSAPPQATFTRSLDNGSLVFVMFSPSPGMDEQEGGLASLDPKWRVRRKSGVYRINSPSDPLWTIDSYATSFDVSSDGVHLVLRYPAWDRTHKVIMFLKNGELIRAYTVGELTDTSNFKPNLGPLSWASQMLLDDERKQYFVKTSNGESYTFDLATGRIVSHWAPRSIAIVSSVLFVGLSAFIVFRLRKRKLQNVGT